jgi:hypothetical protein
MTTSRTAELSTNLTDFERPAGYTRMLRPDQ